MSHMLLEELPELYKSGQFRKIVWNLRWFCNDELPADINSSIVVGAILRTFHPYAEEHELQQTAALIWQLERQGFLVQNDLDKISNAIREAFQTAKRQIPFCLSSTELIHELQQLHAEGQYLQILRRLRQYGVDKLPSGIDVSIAVEAIIRTLRSSSDEDDISRATGVRWQLERQSLLNPNDSDRVWSVIGEVYLNAKGKMPSLLIHALLSPEEKVVPENLIRIYTQANTREAQFELAHWIGAFYKEQGLLVLVDNLYAQQVIGNDGIGAILEKYPLLAGVSLEPEECDAVISAMLDYLEIPGHRIENMKEEQAYEIESINRTSAARVLVVLNRYPDLTDKSRVRLQRCNSLIVTHHCVDRMYDVFEAIPLRRYLSGDIN
jgi:hypothetical protein